MSSKITFEFIEQRFDYKLPLLGVDVQFTKNRRNEILSCMQQLAKKVSEINIASSKGVADFALANKLVKYYYYALSTVNQKEDLLINGPRVISDKERLSHEVIMREHTKERTR